VSQFPVHELGADVRRERAEQLGSKPKFWFRHADGKFWLFKYARPNTGEHWAEKIAAEIAQMLGLPHAVVQLARHEGKWGVMTCDFTNEGLSSLVHGNELLTELDPKYPAAHTYHVRAHTLDAVQAVLGQEFIKPPASNRLPRGFAPFDVFVGYLLLDALIGNTDRHHENWGVLLASSSSLRRSAELAPTFDHASSLGRELTDDGRRNKHRRGGLEAASQYFSKARSALFLTPQARKPMSPLQAFRTAAAKAAPAGQFWLDQLRVHHHELNAVLNAVPDEAMTPVARSFCDQLLSTSARTLLE
jgi:hypothetical protein